MNLLSVLLAVFIFGALIFIHEFGHYTAARIFGVKIYEFAIGMGPKVLSRVSKKTDIRYSLRLLPIGGFVAMAGEDEASDDPSALCNKPVWQRMIITAAGAAMNLITGFLLMAILVTSSANLGGTRVAGFVDESVSCYDGLQIDDEITHVGDTRVHVLADLVYTIMHDADDPETRTVTVDGKEVEIPTVSVDLTVIRNGQRIELEDVSFWQNAQGGHIYGDRDFLVYTEPKTFGNIVKQSYFQSVNTVVMIWESLLDMFSGEYSVKDLSGPVGVTGAIAEAASISVASVVNMTVFITISLGIFNLLPIPALDGGRLLFQLIELIFRKPVSPKIEGYIHFAGLVLLMALMVFVVFQDIFKLIQA